MSWHDYVDGYLVNLTDWEKGTARNICEHGAIFGNTDGTIWAATPGFRLAKYTASLENDDGSVTAVVIDEFANIRNFFNNHGLALKRGGIRIGHERYLVIHFNPEKGLLYLKKKGGGACIAQSNSAFVISIFNTAYQFTDFTGEQETQNLSMVSFGCEALQSFLIENNL